MHGIPVICNKLEQIGCSVHVYYMYMVYAHVHVTSYIYTTDIRLQMFPLAFSQVVAHDQV